MVDNRIQDFYDHGYGNRELEDTQEIYESVRGNCQNLDDELKQK